MPTVRKFEKRLEAGEVRTRILVLILLLAAAGATVYLRHLASAPDGAFAEPVIARPPPQAYAGHPRIDDAAAILAPFGPRLGRMTDALRDDLGVDLHVVTTTSADGTIEAQADRLFQQRNVGGGAPTGGVLVVLNPANRSARIEVGYSLEGGLTDLDMGRVARDQLAPYASYGAAGMAVMDVVHQLSDRIHMAAARGQVRLGDEYLAKPKLAEFRRYASGGAGAMTRLSTIPIDADLKRPVPADERDRYAPGTSPAASVEAFLAATADLAGDPTLPLFTEGSQRMRARYPLAPLEEAQRHERVLASMPLVYRENGDHVVVTSDRPAKGFVPILLHREAGVWKVDLVETWKNLFFDAEGNYFLRNSNTPYAPGLAQFGKGRWYDIAALPLHGRSLEDALDPGGARSPDPLGDLRRAEIWFRNAFVFHEALAAFEAARRAAPGDPLIAQTLGDRAAYLGFPELAIEAWEQIGAGLEIDLARAHDEAGDGAAALAWIGRALAENPHDLRALQWKAHLLRKAGRADEAAKVVAAGEALVRNPEKPAEPVTLRFNPRVPRFEPDATIEVGGTRVHDHSAFGVEMRNRSNRTVEIESVTLTSYGTSAPSGLGDIRDYWKFPSGGHRLGPGESVRFSKQWGFTVDTGHQHVRYVFHTCWNASGTRQCRTQWVDALPERYR